MSEPKILAINPGSTSTKIAVYEGERPFFEKNISHSTEELSKLADLTEQFHFRKELILKELKSAGIDPSTIEVIVARGGLLKPVPSGVYAINEPMLKDLQEGFRISRHASNLAGLIAFDITRDFPTIAAYIADPPVVDELDDVARITGHPLFVRKTRFHALNQKAVARKYAMKANRLYEELNLIVAHLGGGISVGAHRKGLIVDVNDALDGDGPFTPDRSGTVPAGDLASLCFNGSYSHDEVKRMLTGKGGLTAYLGTNDVRKVEKRIADGDEQARLVLDAMIYQISKEIGAMYTALEGDVDAIILTGGIAHSTRITDAIRRRIRKLAPLVIYPGEDEMEALALNGLLLLRGDIRVKEYR